MRYIIGIDPGAKTGFCAWDMRDGRIARIFTHYIHRAQKDVLEYHQAGELAGVIFEDARLRKWFGNFKKGSKEDIDRLMGAGSIRRDSTQWEHFLTDYGIKFITRSPEQKGIKIKAVDFKRMAPYVKIRTDEHCRDAYALVAGLTRWPAL